MCQEELMRHLKDDLGVRMLVDRGSIKRALRRFKGDTVPVVKLDSVLRPLIAYRWGRA